MYSRTEITGVSLPMGTLCLTYDDGPGQSADGSPGPHTLHLAHYLRAQGIQATFFVVGRHAEQFPTILPELRHLGHLLANHTFDHPRLREHLQREGDVVGQVLQTDALIKKWIDGSTIYFRPPYGYWSPDLEQTLNGNFDAVMHHVGPVTWDIDCGDWDYWRRGESPERCVEAYLTNIDLAGRGIVLMHDSIADRPVVLRRNRTYEMTRLLIPLLKARGYRFVRLDAVPEVAAAAQKPLRFVLSASNGHPVSPQSNGLLLVSGPEIGPWDAMAVTDLGNGKVALCTTRERYLSPQGGGGGEVLANRSSIGDWEALDLISVGHTRVAFRTTTGHFLTWERSEANRLMAKATRMSATELFTFTLVGI